ncbi:MAG: HAMP domain-containing protein [Proteobacteria bacterium]|nr:HAMP domain-containing protein [Pseudomonadota bacterium]
MRPSKLIHTATFRLTSLTVLLFALAVTVLGAGLYLTTCAMLDGRLDRRVSDEMTRYEAAFASGGLPRLLETARAHETALPAGQLKYAVADAGGKVLAGDLSGMPKQTGWSNVTSVEEDGDVSRLRVLAADLPGGLRIAIGANREEVEETKQSVFNGIVSVFAAVVVLGIIGGGALSLALMKRVETIRRTADAIIAGDFTQRVPVRGTGDDFDRLAETLNHMLDRITGLMESLRQVSTDIAHDLKTPLAHLRQRLEVAGQTARSNEEHAAAIDGAIDKVDDILATFDALLRIAQIEAGTRRANFSDVDLSAVVANVVEAFSPAAVDGGRSVVVDIAPDIHVAGDRQLLTQLFANLVENAIHHTPSGTRISVALVRDGQGAVAVVRDDGRGVPAAERELIFRRFYRLERSRSTPGNGLGLSLVKAVADLHGVIVGVEDAGPGLIVVMTFREVRASGAATETRHG